MQQHKTYLTGGEKCLTAGTVMAVVGVFLLTYCEAEAGIRLAVVLFPICWALIVTGLALWVRGAFLRNDEIADEM